LSEGAMTFEPMTKSRIDRFTKYKIRIAKKEATKVDVINAQVKQSNGIKSFSYSE